MEYGTEYGNYKEHALLYSFWEASAWSYNSIDRR